MHTSSHSPPTVATINLRALTQNLDQVRRRIPAACQVLAVVKANAYGHGAVEVTRALQRCGVSRFGVATVEEGAILRKAGVQDQILVMGAVTEREFPDLLAEHLIPVLYRADMITRLAACVDKHQAPYPVHVKIETGMGRLGIRPQELPELVTLPAFRSALKLDGIMSHLADADNRDVSYTRAQLEVFDRARRLLEQEHLLPPLLHLANSAALLTQPGAHYSLVRPGIMLYGYHTLSEPPSDLALQPVLTWTTTVAHVRTVQPGESVSYNRTFVAERPSRIAVLPVGYADGYSRQLSNRGAVLIGGRRAPVVGRVCMDMTMVDVTDIPAIEVGSEAVLIGRQGQEVITAADLAAWQQTIPYEVLCAIGPRVPRRYDPPTPA